MLSFARKTLEIYLKERRIITPAEFSTDDIPFTNTKDAVFVTLFLGEKVIASQGRIACKKENTLLECLDLTLFCLKDPRFSENFSTPEILPQIRIRIDTFNNTSRRQIKTISEWQADEGLIFLSPALGKMSVILPNMVKNPTPEKMLDFAKRKAGVEEIWEKDMFLYALKTNSLTE